MNDNTGRRVLPCPFCGSPAKVHKRYNGFRKVTGFYVCCNVKGCPVFASTRVKKEKGVIIDEWNTRKSEDENKMLREVILLAPGTNEKEFLEKYKKWWDTFYREIRSPGCNLKNIEQALKGER